MSFDASTLAIVFISASLVVSAMMLHYIWRARRGTDMLCLFGMLGPQLGLLHTGRTVEQGGNIFYAASTAFVLFVLAVGIWQMGLKRLRDAA